MMLMPSIFGESLFDDWMDFPFERENARRAAANNAYAKAEKNLMKTDIRETDTSYELDIDLPGFKKENVSAQLENGYLTIHAEKGLDKDEKDSEGKYIRRERFTGHCSRSFYVGKEITQQDIRAKFENGILKLTVPKKDAKAVEQSKYISIEG